MQREMLARLGKGFNCSKNLLSVSVSAAVFCRQGGIGCADLFRLSEGSTQMQKIGCILVYLKYWTLKLMPLMVYPKVLFHPTFSVSEAAW